MSDYLQKYRKGEINALDYLSNVLKEINFDEAKSQERVVAVIGDMFDLKNLCYVVGKTFGSMGVTGVMYTPASTVFREGLKQFSPGKIRLFKGNIPLPDELNNEGLGKLITILDKNNS